MKQQTKIEYLSQPSQQFSRQYTAGVGFFSSRLKIFIFSFLFCFIFGLIINYSRPPVYQSNATLLTSAATAVDQSSGDVDLQHVTIQKQKLLGAELLSETLARIKSSDNHQMMADLTLQDIRNMLNVEPIEQTNLLNMFAEGPVPEILPVVINTWIDVYLDARALSVKNSAHNTVELVKSELTELENQIEQSRKELDLFRKEHDISSIAREENELPATLKSLTQAFNNANENVVKTKARLDAINQAIANDQTVVPEREQGSLRDLEKRHQELTEKLAEFDKRFTRDYLALQPSLKYIPEQIKKLERAIKKKRNRGKSIVWTEATQDYQAARQVLAKIRQQLDEHKKKAASFNNLFSRHQKLMDDLESLEKMDRETRDRLIKIESKQFEKYPQVDVVERASINLQAISPNYNFGVLIVLIASLVLAFFTVWMSEFLMQDQSEQRGFNFPISVWFGSTQQHETIEQQKSSNFVERKSQNGLTYTPVYKKVSDDDIQLLLNKSDRNTQQLILLLLSGLTLEEISDLKCNQINFDQSFIQLSGDSPRQVFVSKRLLEILNESIQEGFLWGQQKEISVEDLNATLYCSAVDIGFNDSDGMLSELLRQTYIIYLVEQGIRLAMLAKIVGYLSPLELAGYAGFSPQGEGCDAEQIQLIHPACR